MIRERTNQRVTTTRCWAWRADGGRENPQQVTATRWWWWRADGGLWLVSQAEGAGWLALQVEGVGEPPTSRNDLLGVDVAGVTGGGGERAPTRWGSLELASQVA